MIGSGLFNSLQVLMEITRQNKQQSCWRESDSMHVALQLYLAQQQPVAVGIQLMTREFGLNKQGEVILC